MRADGPEGDLIGRFGGPESTDEFETWTADLDGGGITGVHDCYLVDVTPEKAQTFRLDWFTFE